MSLTNEFKDIISYIESVTDVNIIAQIIIEIDKIILCRHTCEYYLQNTILMINISQFNNHFLSLLSLAAAKELTKLIPDEKNIVTMTEEIINMRNKIEQSSLIEILELQSEVNHIIRSRIGKYAYNNPFIHPRINLQQFDNYILSLLSHDLSDRLFIKTLS